MSRLLASGAIVAGLVTAILTLLTAFGVGITEGERDAILGFVAAALGFLGVWFHPDTPVGPQPKP